MIKIKCTSTFYYYTITFVSLFLIDIHTCNFQGMSSTQLTRFIVDIIIAIRGGKNKK